MPYCTQKELDEKSEQMANSKSEFWTTWRVTNILSKKLRHTATRDIFGLSTSEKNSEK